MVEGFLKAKCAQNRDKTGREVCMQPCADWTKMKNIRQMYDVIYDELVKACVAINLDYPVFTDRDGKEVEEDERFGLKQDIKITHPHYIMFAAEKEEELLHDYEGGI